MLSEPKTASRVLLDWLKCPEERPSSSGRYVCIDFETNGISERGAPFKHWTLPCQNYPTQLSVDIVEDGMVAHVYDTYVRGATSMSAWAKQNTPITLEALSTGRPLAVVVEDLADLIQPGDTLVAHNVHYDLNQSLAYACRKQGIDSPALNKILCAPRFCTMRCAYSKTIGKQIKLETLCHHFEVHYCSDQAHDAIYDTSVLAQCVAEAWRRGVMF